MAYWLFKSEPGCFSIDDLKNRPAMTEHWDGVRNYQARNYLRDQVKVGDQVFFYHSNIPEPGVVGLAEVVREGYPDSPPSILQASTSTRSLLQEILSGTWWMSATSRHSPGRSRWKRSRRIRS